MGGFLYDSSSQSVLLHKRDAKAPIYPNQWSVFGGNSEGDELPVDCFVREFKEETGVTIPKERVRLLEKFYADSFGKDQYHYFAEFVIPKSAVVLTEGEGFDWIPLREVEHYPLSEVAIRALRVFRQEYAKA